MGLVPHKVFGPGYPPGGILCLCEIDRDHNEDEMEER